LKIVNWHFLVTSKSTVLKGLCQSDFVCEDEEEEEEESEEK